MSDGPATQAIETYHFADDGTVPNNPLPLVVYRGALPDCGDRAAFCEAMFARNNWPNSWHNGIYSYHHYHSTAHEVLGIARGNARVRLGGENGRSVELQAGDVVVIPAGVAHKREFGQPRSAGDRLLSARPEPGYVPRRSRTGTTVPPPLSPRWRCPRPTPSPAPPRRCSSAGAGNRVRDRDSAPYSGSRRHCRPGRGRSSASRSRSPACTAR